MILIRCVASCMFTAVNPLTRKCPVALESEKTHLTAFSNLIVLKMVVAIDRLFRLFAWTICCHAAECVVVCHSYPTIVHLLHQRLPLGYNLLLGVAC